MGVAWGVIGAAIDCYETALAYAKSREQFGRPIAGFQLVQEKLVWMAQEITKAQLLALRLTRMMEAGTASPRADFAGEAQQRMDGAGMRAQGARYTGRRGHHGSLFRDPAPHEP